MRRFQLQRNFDITGVSGVGIVARGVRFEDAVTIHGHDGATQFVFVDDGDT